MANLLREARQALRTLCRHPAFTAVAALTLALGIGANTAIFSVIDGVLLEPLPYGAADRLMRLYERGLDGSYDDNSTTPGNFSDWQADARTFEAMAAYTTVSRNVIGVAGPQRLIGAISMGSIFEVLQVAPLLGRTYTRADDASSADPVVVLSYRGWQRTFGGDRDVLGETLTLSGTPHTVIGVMPPDFKFPDRDALFWTPARFSAEFREDRTQYFLNVVARLAPDASVETARAEMATIMARLRAEYPEENANAGVRIVPLHDDFVAAAETRLLILMGAVAFVLLIACANLVNLLLARATRRRGEIALRRALGASRWRVVRGLMVESLILATLGAGLGLLLGAFLLDLLLSVLPEGTPRLDEVAIDGTVLVFTLGVSLLAGLVTGLFPALRYSKAASAEAIREGTSGIAGRTWARGALVVSELALAVVLLAGAGLLIRSFWLLSQVDPGFRTENVVTFNVSLPGSDYPSIEGRLAFFDRALERVRAVPGVRSASIINNLPGTGQGIGAWFNILDRPVSEGESRPVVRYRVVDPSYFETMRVPLLRGRTLTQRDGMEAPAMVINETAARRFWPDGDPLGARIILGPPDEGRFPATPIVGVVRDVKNLGLGAEPPPVAYVPQRLMPFWAWFSFVVHTETEPTAVMPAVRAEIQTIDAALPIYGVRTMEQIVAESMAPTRASMILLGIFAAIALGMAAVGVFGVLSYIVSQRVREIGIRMALGADAARIRAMIVRQGMLWGVIGIGLGLAAAWALTRLMSSLLYGISAVDPLTFLGVVVFLAVVTALAAFLPARRATRIDPMEALRYE